MDPTPNRYHVGESIWLKALFLTGATVGSIQLGQFRLSVREADDLDLTVGAAIIVVGAGALGGDLTTTVASTSADGQLVTLAEAALTETSLAPVGNPSAPSSVSCMVKKPDGSTETVSVQNPSAGRYRGLFTPTLDGDHYYRFIGDGTATARRWRKLVVLPERVAA